MGMEYQGLVGYCMRDEGYKFVDTPCFVLMRYTRNFEEWFIDGCSDELLTIQRRQLLRLPSNISSQDLLRRSHR